MKLREAAQQALEALDCPGKAKTADEQDAITALRAALADHDRAWYTIDEINAKFDPKPVQEEVYWYVGTDGKYYSSNEVKLFMDANTKGLHLDPPQWRKDKGDLIPLYAAPPQRKPLTEEEIKDCETQAMVNGALPFEQRVFFARAIERAHGIGDE